MSFFQLILKNLLRQRTRTVLTLVGIAVGITTVVALGAIVDGMKNVAGEMLVTGDADFMVAQKGAADMAFSSVPQADAEALRERDDVAWAHPFVLHIIRVGSNPFFILGGMAPADIAEGAPEIVAGGLLPADDSDAIMLGVGAADALGAGVGDTVTIGDTTFTVVGIYRSDATWLDNGAYAGLARVQELASKPDMVTGAFVKVAPGYIVSEVADAIETDVPGIASIADISEYGEVDQGMLLMDAANLAISLLAVGIGAVGVMNTMVMSVFERTREIGILRAVGWSGQRIVRMIVTESLLLCLVAAVAGILLGVLATRAVMLVETISSILEPRYSVEIVVRALLVGIVVALIGAVYPAIRAVRLTPMEALRHE